MGTVYLVITLVHLIDICLLPSHNPATHTILLWSLSVVFKVLIAWYAYKGLRIGTQLPDPHSFSLKVNGT